MSENGLHVSIVEKVKIKLKEYELVNGSIHDDEYESLFVKYYVDIMTSDRSFTNPPKINHRKNGLH
jgi:hypothetical protein